MQVQWLERMHNFGNLRVLSGLASLKAYATFVMCQLHFRGFPYANSFHPPDNTLKQTLLLLLFPRFWFLLHTPPPANFAAGHTLPLCRKKPGNVFPVVVEIIFTL